MKDYILRRIVAAYVTDANGVPTAIDILDHLGVSLLSGLTPQPPQVIGALDAISLTVGEDPVTVDLATAFSGATSYETSALPAGVTRSGAIITVTAGAVLAATTITIRGRNAGGLSEPVTLSVAVAAAPPQLATPASISPASGPVGTVFTITPAIWSGTGPFTRAGTLEQAGVVVETRSGSSIAPFPFTGTATGPLPWSETISGPGGSASAEASATIANTAPSLAPAQITVSGDDLVFPAPAITGGAPLPSLSMTALTVNGTSIIGSLSGNTLIGAAIPTSQTRVYFVTWTATNGTVPNAVRTATYTIEAVAQAEWQVSAGPGPNQATLTSVPVPPPVIATAGPDANQVTIEMGAA
ncbi:hypothetical protein [Paracoccus hibiscisoli]|uniref:Uncharacterized protein n=1 Tax=Paracoccus hibiscisoli TaxID=2023261 RepID=A0A4U0QVK0_9RHOB|nr:hypothetical protein [Paracoccus hibiscisoli]TJZ86167.1 hypothetical protein FA740_04570 [Paracoccus hibiscisoli]